MGKTWLGWKIAAHIIDLADRAAHTAVVLKYHRQVAGAQQLLAGRLSIFAQVDTERFDAPIAEVDHQAGALRLGGLGLRRAVFFKRIYATDRRRSRACRGNRQQCSQQDEGGKDAGQIVLGSC
jgi:hypothetical protein